METKLNLKRRLSRLESRNPDRPGGVVFAWQDRGEAEAAAIAKAWADHVAAFGRPPRDVICVSWDWRGQDGAAC